MEGGAAEAEGTTGAVGAGTLLDNQVPGEYHVDGRSLAQLRVPGRHDGRQSHLAACARANRRPRTARSATAPKAAPLLVTIRTSHDNRQDADARAPVSDQAATRPPREAAALFRLCEPNRGVGVDPVMAGRMAS